LNRAFFLLNFVMMKILQINSARNFGGGEKHLIDLCRGLQNRGHEVFAAVRPNNHWEKKLDFLPLEKIIRYPMMNSLDIFSAREIAGFVRERRIEIIHAHVARDYPIAALASRVCKTPLILTRHLTYKLSGLHRFTFRQAGKIIAVSNGVAESLMKGGLVAVEKISIVQNGVDTFLLEKIKRSPADLVVATIGEIREHKGQEDFIRAAAIVAKKHPNVKFLIIGQDNSANREYRRFLENLVKELNLQNQVIFTGWLDNPAEIYESFDIFVSAAQSEPFGLVIAEAMASGKGIVATKTVGANELLTDNESGKLVEIGHIEQIAEAITQLLEDENLRRTLGENARQRAKEFFSLEKMVSETEKVYQYLRQKDI
jgi:L-malate glycosyltransferase